MRGDFLLGDWLVQPQLNLLSHAGQSVHIEPKVMQVLVYLADHPGDVVSKKELKKVVWEDSYVTDDVLTRSISELRKALADDPKNPEMIQTIPRGGYRLIAPVRPADEAPVLVQSPERVSVPVLTPAPDVRAATTASAPAPVRSWRKQSWAIFLLVALIGTAFLIWFTTVRTEGPVIKSLAVLPLKNLSADPEESYFADSMTEALISDIANIGPLQVTSRTSVMRYRTTVKSIAEIARELRVDALLEGSVMRVGNRVRITAQLINARTDTNMWSASYERDFRDLLILQKEVARAVADEVKITLSPRERERLSSAESLDPEAYQAYLRGRYFWNQRTQESMERAAEYFESAVSRAPRFALAYAGLADAYTLLGHYRFWPPEQAFPKAKLAALKALELDNSSAEAYASLGFVSMSYERDWVAAERSLRKAAELKPNYATAHHWLGLCLLGLGRTDEAIREAEQAKQLDPVSLATNTFLAQCLLLSRQYDRAIKQSTETVRLYPESAPPRIILAESLWRGGKAREALVQIELVKRFWEDDPVKIRVTEQFIAGHPSRALNEVQGYMKSNQGDCPDPMFCAEAYALAGQKDPALRWLGKAFEQRESRLLFLGIDPTFAPLKSDPRFVELLRRLGL